MPHAERREPELGVAHEGEQVGDRRRARRAARRPPGGLAPATGTGREPARSQARVADMARIVTGGQAITDAGRRGRARDDRSGRGGVPRATPGSPSPRSVPASALAPPSPCWRERPCRPCPRRMRRDPPHAGATRDRGRRRRTRPRSSSPTPGRRVGQAPGAAISGRRNIAASSRAKLGPCPRTCRSRSCWTTSDDGVPHDIGRSSDADGRPRRHERDRDRRPTHAQRMPLPALAPGELPVRRAPGCTRTWTGGCIIARP